MCITPAQVDEVLGDRKVTMEDLRALRYTTRVINEGMRLYPQVGGKICYYSTAGLATAA